MNDYQGKNKEYFDKLVTDAGTEICTEYNWEISEDFGLTPERKETLIIAYGIKRFR